MSEGYVRDRKLVSEDASYYERALDTTIALTVVTFVLGLLTLVKAVGLETSGGALGEFFLGLLVVAAGGVGTVGLVSYLDVVPITSQRIRGVGVGLLVALVGLVVVAYPLGVSMADVLGLCLLTQAAVLVAAGVVSRRGGVDTNPSRSAGLLAGGMFAVIGALIGAALGGTVFGGTTLAYAASALAGGAGLAALTVVPREDLGSTLPVAVLVGILGLVVAAGLIDVGWQWQPGETIDGTFTGGVVVPLFVLQGSLLSSWAAAKCRAGFGAPGRQYGAYLVINLNALLMVTVMVAIVAFVAMKGATYAFHGFTIGAASALVVVAPLLVLALDFARRPAGSDQWHSGVRQFVRVVPLAAVGSLAALLASVVLTGDSLEVPFTYTVLTQSRTRESLDTALSVTPVPKVGTLLVLFVGVFLFVYLFRRYGSLRDVGRRSGRLDAVQRAVGLVVLGMAVLSLVLAVAGKRPFGVPLADTLGLALVAAGAVGAGALAVLPLVAVATGEGSLTDRVRDAAQFLVVGLFGGLGLLAAATVLEPAAGANPSVGPVNLVPALATGAAVASLAVAAGGVFARRTAGSTIDRRILGEEVTLGLTAAAGFVTLVALHVALTGVSFTVAGATVGRLGTLSWPMTMEAYIPLGLEPGGILPAVVGTIWLVFGASVFAVPLGVGAAVFLTEYAEQGKFTALVEIATNALWSTPSVVFGLFGAAFLIPRLGGDESIMSGMLVLGFMLLPLVLITSREAIKAVPDEYRDASAALGVNRWQTIRSVVLPAALPGVITGVILGVGRIAGETAPLILVLGSTLNATEAIDILGGFEFVAQPPFVANDALLQASASLPTQVWAVIAAGVSGSPSMGWASAFVLLLVVLTFYAVGIVSRTYFRRKLDYE
jgi:phosphate transport system permease protein